MVQTMTFLTLKTSPCPISSRLDRNIRLRTQFSNNLSTASFLIREHVSQPYRMTGNVIDLSIFIFKFIERSRVDNIFLTG